MKGTTLNQYTKSAGGHFVHQQKTAEKIAAETDNQKSYLRGKRYENEKLKVGDNQFNTNRGGHFVHPSKTAEKIANETGVKERTIRRDEQFSKAIELLRR